MKEIDKKHVIAANLYRLRRLHNYTREQIGDAIVVTPQQIRKYETATNRISSNNLWAIARFLGVDIKEFFKDVTVKDPVAAFLQSEEYTEAEVSNE